MKKQKAYMGVEVPSFFEYQRRKAEQEAAASGKKKFPFEGLFAPDKPRTQQPPAPPITNAPRPGFPVQPSSFTIDIKKIWERVIDTVTEFGNQEFVIDVLTKPIYNATRSERDFEAAMEIAQLFGIPQSKFQGLSMQQAWNHVMGPFFENLENTINSAKPVRSLGNIRFELEPGTNELLMYYRYQ